MTGFEAYERIERINVYMKALNEAIVQIDEPDLEFGSTYPSNIIKEIVAVLSGEQVELLEKLIKVNIE